MDSGEARVQSAKNEWWHSRAGREPFTTAWRELGLDFDDQENARRMGVESFPRGEHAFDFSGVTPARNAYERPQRSGFEGLRNARWGIAANADKDPIPDQGFTAMHVDNASVGLKRALGLDSAGPVVTNVTPQQAESLTANYAAPLLVTNGPASFAPDGPLPDLKIDYVANCSPGLRKALGL